MSLTAALSRRDVTALPSRRDENWRYTDLRAAVRVLPEPSPRGAVPTVPGPFDQIAADQDLLIVNGFGPNALTLAAGQVRTVRLRFIADANAGSHHADLAIDLAAGAKLLLLESHEGRGASYVSDTALSITLGQGANLERVVIYDEPQAAVSVVAASIALSAGSELSQTVLTHGANRQRFETHVKHPGGGASVRLDGVYLLSDNRHCDLTSTVTHAGAGGTTQQLTKGAVSDGARGVFQGRITVAPGSDQTDARMGHHALILSERAEIDAKPELEIFADDVSCAHGNTVGALDEDALFYICSRGVPADEARSLLIAAFVGEVIDQIGTESVQTVARHWLNRSGIGGPIDGL